MSQKQQKSYFKKWKASIDTFKSGAEKITDLEAI